MTKQSVFCLMGPTAAGKTALACDIVKRFPCEIISVDSALIYRGMDIGTAKPDADILALAPHHLIDIRNPIESYSAADFCADAQRLCAEIFQRNRIPFFVGGTMMYFRALQQGLAKLPEANADIRATLLQQAAAHGWDFLYQHLKTVDPSSARKIHPHDTQRVQRALEVFMITKQPLSTLHQASTNDVAYDYINFLLLPTSRQWLHDRIEQRFEQMLGQGLIAEVHALLQQWPLTSAHPAFRSVGYRQVFEYLQGQYDGATLRAKGIAATRQLAKRQLTWLRHWPNGHILTAETPEHHEKMIALMQQILDNKY